MKAHTQNQTKDAVHRTTIKIKCAPFCDTNMTVYLNFPACCKFNIPIFQKYCNA